MQYRITQKNNKYFIEKKLLWFWKKIGLEFNNKFEAMKRYSAYYKLNERKKYVPETKFTVEDVVKFQEISDALSELGDIELL